MESSIGLPRVLRNGGSAVNFKRELDDSGLFCYHMYTDGGEHLGLIYRGCGRDWTVYGDAKRHPSLPERYVRMARHYFRTLGDAKAWAQEHETHIFRPWSLQPTLIDGRIFWPKEVLAYNRVHIHDSRVSAYKALCGKILRSESMMSISDPCMIGRNDYAVSPFDAYLADCGSCVSAHAAQEFERLAGG